MNGTTSTTHDAANTLLAEVTRGKCKDALAKDSEAISAVGVRYATVPGYTFDNDGSLCHVHAVLVPEDTTAKPHAHWLSPEWWRVMDGDVEACLGTTFADL